MGVRGVRGVGTNQGVAHLAGRTGRGIYCLLLTTYYLLLTTHYSTDDAHLAGHAGEGEHADLVGDPRPVVSCE